MSSYSQPFQYQPQLHQAPPNGANNQRNELQPSQNLSPSLREHDIYRSHIKALEEKIVQDSIDHSKLVQAHANCQTSILTLKNQLKVLLENKVSMIKQLQESERMRLALLQQNRKGKMNGNGGVYSQSAPTTPSNYSNLMQLSSSSPPPSHMATFSNPALMMELEMLRSENKDLKMQLNTSHATVRELDLLKQENELLKKKVKHLEEQYAAERERMIDADREKKTLAHELMITKAITQSKMKPSSDTSNLHQARSSTSGMSNQMAPATGSSSEEDILVKLERELAQFRTRTFMAEASLAKLEQVSHDRITKYERKIRSLKKKLKEGIVVR